MAEDYQVQAGDCMNSIAYDRGFFWETLWNHANNAGLKKERKDPNVLMEGDVVHIPDLTRKQESGGTEKRHRFRFKGVPGKLILTLTQPDEESRSEEGTDPNAEPTGKSKDPDATDPKPQKPWSGAAWKCIIDGKPSTGTTGSDGRIELRISPGAREGKLIVDADKPTQRVITLRLGHLDPADSPSGAMQRLRGLGYQPGTGGPPGTDDSDGQAQLRNAVESFQGAHGMDRTGVLDRATMDKLKEVHGS